MTEFYKECVSVLHQLIRMTTKYAAMQQKNAGAEGEKSDAAENA